MYARGLYQLAGGVFTGQAEVVGVGGCSKLTYSCACLHIHIVVIAT